MINGHRAAKFFPCSGQLIPVSPDDRFTVEGKYYLTGEKLANKKVAGSDIDDLFKA